MSKFFFSIYVLFEVELFFLKQINNKTPKKQDSKS